MARYFPINLRHKITILLSKATSLSSHLHRIPDYNPEEKRLGTEITLPCGTPDNVRDGHSKSFTRTHNEATAGTL